MNNRFLLFVVFIISHAIVFARAWTESGNYDISWFKSSESSFTISTPQQLAGIAYLVNNRYTDFNGKTIQLQCDIDLIENTWKGIGSKNYYFMGTFDGNGHQIRNIAMLANGGEYPHVGFFNCIYKSTIKNLYLSGFVSLHYDSAAYPETIAGGLCAWAKDSKIENVNSAIQISYFRTETLHFDYKISIGGLIGEAVNYTSIFNSYHNQDIHVEFFREQKGAYTSCTMNIGGITGESDEVTINQCGRPEGKIYVNANCTSSNTSTVYTNVGGIAGSARSANISYCYNNTPEFDIYLGSNSGLKFGGIAGYSSIYSKNGIINCYSSSKIFHIDANQRDAVYYGGIVGQIYPSDAANLKANYSPSDITITCIHSLNLVAGYSGLTSFTNSQMTESAFLDELNLYNFLNNQEQLWVNRSLGLGYPTHISESNAVYSPSIDVIYEQTIYDISGQKAPYPEPGKIYIRGGKKFIYR